MYGQDEHDYKNLDTFNGKFQEGSKRYHKFEEYMLSQGFSSKENKDYDKEALMRVLNYELYPDKLEEGLISMVDKMGI